MKSLLGYQRLGGEPDFDAVRELLRSVDLSVRMRAVESLRRSGDPRSSELLFDALGDESHHVKNVAIELLAARPTEERVTRLVELVLKDDPNRRLAAAKVLHRLGEPRAADALAAALEHPSDGKLRVEAIEALGKIGGARAVEALVLKLEDDTEDEEPRALAANALVDIGDPAAIEPLERVLVEIDASAESREENPFGAALEEALSQLRAMHPGSQRARKPPMGSLVKRLAATDPAHRVRAAEALGRRRDTTAVEPLIARLSDPEPAVRAAAAASLGKIGDRLAVGPIAHLTRDPSLADASTTSELGRSGLLVCDAASAALGALGGAEAETALLEALESDSADVRMPAAGALTTCAHNRRTLDVIARLLNDPSPAVICAAIGGLSDWKRAARDTTADYTNAELLSVLERASRHDDHEVRFQALCGLDRFWKAATARHRLREALEDSHEVVRGEAIRLLGQRRAMEAIPRILEMLRHDCEASVRAAAAEAVGLHFARAEDMDALIAALDDPDSRVREGAASAIASLYQISKAAHRDAVPRLTELLSRETNGFVREAAQRALAQLGVTAP